MPAQQILADTSWTDSTILLSDMQHDTRETPLGIPLTTTSGQEPTVGYPYC